MKRLILFFGLSCLLVAVAQAQIYVDPTGNDTDPGTAAMPLATIQAAIDMATPPETILVRPGTYNEQATGRPVSGTGTGPNNFGLYIGKDDITIQGVDAADNPITDYNDPNLPEVVSTAASVFGTQGPFISGDNVTIIGLGFTAFDGGTNKNIEVTGNNFTLRHSRVRASSFGSSVYISDFDFMGDDVSGTSTITSYTIEDNWMDQGTIVVANGAGFGSPMMDLIIRDNLIQNAGNWGISMNGALNTVAWLNHPVGVPTITGNTFDNNFGHVRFLGTYDTYPMSYWNDILANNTMVEGWVVAYDGTGPDLRATEFEGYTTRREIGSVIQDQIDRAEPNDLVQVSAGTFNEQLVIDKALTLQGTSAATTILDGTSIGGTGISIQSGDVTVTQFTVENYDEGIIAGYPLNTTAGYWQNIRIIDNIVQNIGPGAPHGFGIYVGFEAEGFGDSRLSTHLDFSGLEISGNEVNTTQNAALVLQSITSTSGTPLMVINNTFQNAGASGTWMDTAREIEYTGNTLMNNNFGVYLSSIADGFFVTDGTYGPQNIAIEQNSISASTSEGVALYAGWPSTINVNENDIFGNGYGVRNFLSENLDATRNWWGDASGPSDEGPGTGDAISTFVLFCPYYDDVVGVGMLVGQPIVITGQDLDACLNKTIQLEGATVSGGATEATWSIASEPEPNAGSVTNPDPTDPSQGTFTGTVAGTYTLELTSNATGGAGCGPVTEVFTIEVLNVGCGEFPWTGGNP